MPRRHRRRIYATERHRTPEHGHTPITHLQRRRARTSIIPPNDPDNPFTIGNIAPPAAAPLLWLLLSFALAGANRSSVFVYALRALDDDDDGAVADIVRGVAAGARR